MTSPEILGQFIPLHYHYDMLRDHYRMTAFRQAIDYAVRPGMVVVDLGGGTGVLSYFAATRGAKVIYVERNPELVQVAEQFFRLNGVASDVSVVLADAASYVPPHAVDAVICEMLHVGLIREKQTEVISAFKQNYRDAIGPRLPRFIPEASLLAIQPVSQDYCFAGFHAPGPLFQPPLATVSGTSHLCDPALYQTIIYDQPMPERVDWRARIAVRQTGIFNAVRFITKNVLAVVLESASEICWHNQYLVLPLPRPLDVASGDWIDVHLNYRFGEELAQLRSGLEACFIPTRQHLATGT